MFQLKGVYPFLGPIISKPSSIVWSCSYGLNDRLVKAKVDVNATVFPTNDRLDDFSI
jgi:hypothetical protein